jgi:hypothetical protein
MTQAETAVVTLAYWNTNIKGTPAEATLACWILDTDGWCYWSQPLMPDTATNLLLDNVQMTANPDDNWAYYIDVNLQASNKTEIDDMIDFGGTTGGKILIPEIAGRIPGPSAPKTSSIKFDSGNLTTPVDHGAQRFEIPSVVYTDTGAAVPFADLTFTVNGTSTVTFQDGKLGLNISQADWDSKTNVTITATLKSGDVTVDTANITVNFNKGTGTGGDDGFKVDPNWPDWTGGNPNLPVWKNKETEYNADGMLINLWTEPENWGDVWQLNETPMQNPAPNLAGITRSDSYISIPMSEIFGSTTNLSGVTVSVKEFAGARGQFVAGTNERGLKTEIVSGNLRLSYVPTFAEIDDAGVTLKKPQLILPATLTFTKGSESVDFMVNIVFAGNFSANIW